jgi:hypothetical protein
MREEFMNCSKLLSAEAKRSAIAVAVLTAVGQLLFIYGLFGGYSGLVA